ncbi:MAG TPA: CPBP family intramembrane metalloprotease [Phycisphaerales bacterium]|nr:CPBP family intramembrane metalloprotease [Phycisphaerales bacterium]
MSRPTRSESASAAATGRRPRRGHSGAQTYAAASARPLHVLAFLAPLILLYEIGAIAYLPGETIAARGILARVFESFGVVGLHLPAGLLVVVLLIWHVLLRDRWRVRGPYLAFMAMEACVWTVPLFLFALLMTAGPALQPEAATAAAELRERSWQARLTLSIGAGLYEELLFRMILIAAAHFVLGDLLRLPDQWAKVGAAVISAVGFMLYHHAATPVESVFFLLAGLYFAGLYILRGFGIVVAVHALYDVLALVIMG